MKLDPMEARMRNLAWSKEEMALLKTNWPINGVRCASLFPRHTETGVRQQAYKQGLKRKYTDPFSAVIRGTRGCGSGVVAGPTFRAMLCREELERLGK